MSFNAAKMMPVRSKGAGTPSEGQLAQIRAFCLDDMAADRLYTRSFVLAHNCIDRDDEVFDEGVLTDFARTLPGKGIFIKHPNGWDGDTGPAEGKWYGAQLQTMSLEDARTLLKQTDLQLPPDRSMVTLLMADGYFAKTPENAGLLTKMDAGIAGDVSVGFCATSRAPIKDAQGRELQAQRIMGPAEALEGSLVWLGAQPGARAIKSANNSTNSQREVPEMDQKQHDELIGAEKAKVTALEPHKQFRDSLKSALGKDHESLADDPATLATLALAGKSASTAMVDDLVAGDRQQGVVGDKPEEVTAAKSAYASLPFAQLKTLHSMAQKRTTGGSQLRVTAQNSDPNNTGANGEKALGDDHPLAGLLQFADTKAA